MSGKKLLVYLGILLVVGGGYFFSEYYHSRQAVQEKAAKQVFQLKADEVQSITLQSDKGQIKIERLPAPSEAPGPSAAVPAASSPVPAATPPAAAQTPPWQLTAPIKSATDDLTLTSLLTALVDLKVERRLDAVTPERLKEFGLDKPLFSLTFEAAGQSHQLRFGHKVPGSQNLYAQKDDDPQILVLRQSDKETLDRNLTALRAKNIFTLKPAEITALRLIRPQEKLIIHKTGPEVWTPGTPLQLKLREDKIKALLGHLANARAIDFVAERAEDLKKYGLAPTPALRLTLLRDGQEETLLLGGQQGDRYYAQVAGKAPIFLVDKTLVERLPQSYDALEDRRLWSGTEAEVQKVTWGSPDQQSVAVREKDDWKLQTWDNQTVQQSAMKFNLALWRLKELEFSRFLQNAVELEKTNPLFTIQLLGPDNRLLFRLAEFAQEKDQTLVMFTSGDRTQAAAISSQTLKEVKELLNRLIMADKRSQGEKPDPDLPYPKNN